MQKIWGYSIVYEDNEVQTFRTLLENLKGAVTGWPQNIRAYFDVAEKFAPDVVITDFESWSYLFGKRHGLPVISVDNMQIINRCKHAPELLDGVRGDFELQKTLIKAKVRGRVPLPHHHLLLPAGAQGAHHPAPAHPAPGDPGRPPEPGEHLLVYQTSTSNAALPEVLARRRPRVPHLRPAPRHHRGRRSRATCATARSARPASSTTCARRAG